MLAHARDTVHQRQNTATHFSFSLNVREFRFDLNRRGLSSQIVELADLVGGKRAIVGANVVYVALPISI